MRTEKITLWHLKTRVGLDENWEDNSMAPEDTGRAGWELRRYLYGTWRHGQGWMRTEKITLWHLKTRAGLDENWEDTSMAPEDTGRAGWELRRYLYGTWRHGQGWMRTEKIPLWHLKTRAGLDENWEDSSMAPEDTGRAGWELRRYLYGTWRHGQGWMRTEKIALWHLKTRVGLDENWEDNSMAPEDTGRAGWELRR